MAGIAASVILGLLSLYDVTHDGSYLTAARRAGDWLRAVAKHRLGGLTWPDYVDAPRRSSTDYFTSFDDADASVREAAAWALRRLRS